MKAIRVHQPGEPDDLKYEAAPAPKPGAARATCSPRWNSPISKPKESTSGAPPWRLTHEKSPDGLAANECLLSVQPNKKAKT